MVEFKLKTSDLAMLDANLDKVVEPGIFKIMIGRSSADIRLTSHLEVTDKLNRRKS